MLLSSRAREGLPARRRIPALAIGPEFCVVSRRHDLLGGHYSLLASLCFVALGLGLGIAALAAWLVLPYCALEMAGLYWALRCIERHASDWEQVSVCGDRVIVENKRAGARMRRNSTATGRRSKSKTMDSIVHHGSGCASPGVTRPSARSCRRRSGPSPRGTCTAGSACGSGHSRSARISKHFGARMERKGAMARGAAFAAGLAPTLARAAKEYNLQPPVTAVATQIFDLHTYIMGICAVIFVGVFSVMFYSIFAHRKSKGHQAAQFHENTLVEIIWTVIPFLILLVMAIPATRTILEMKDTSVPDLTVKITGSQWKWNYNYLAEGFDFYSNLSTPVAQLEGREPLAEHYLLEVDQPLVLPVGKKVRLLITSSDVIHAWFLPAAGVQQDAIPGFVRDDWLKFDQTGTFRGQCAKICGKEHGFMPIVVEVKSADDYATWLAEHKQAAAAAGDDSNKVWDAKELIARGEKVYAANCATCHQATGKGVAGAFPALDGSKVVTGPKDDQIKTVLNGVVKNGQPTAMVAWKGTLSDVDIAAVITYTRNSWSNHTGEAIQPAEVKADRS
jgi:cytochrome c oxidase subunit 2